jgi:uncharacterized protein (DUF427 family)
MTSGNRPQADPVLPGQESVWAFPRPAIAERTSLRVTIQHAGLVLADSCSTVRTLETSHPPSYYFPPDDIRPGLLRAAQGGSFCEWKGQAVYWDVLVQGQVIEGAGWSYPSPSLAFGMLRDNVAFYAGPFDLCTVEGETVVPQPGGFYGGWITSRQAGPFKGGPGSRFW